MRILVCGLVGEREKYEEEEDDDEDKPLEEITESLTAAATTSEVELENIRPN